MRCYKPTRGFVDGHCLECVRIALADAARLRRMEQTPAPDNLTAAAIVLVGEKLITGLGACARVLAGPGDLTRPELAATLESFRRAIAVDAADLRVGAEKLGIKL